MSMNQLPSMEHSFNVDLKCQDTGKHYSGNFTYRRPNIGMRSEISIITARLGQDLKSLSEDIKFFHSVLATLRVCLIDYPKWWEETEFGTKLHDENIIFEIYKKCQEFETEWAKKVWSEENDAEKQE